MQNSKKEKKGQGDLMEKKQVWIMDQIWIVLNMKDDRVIGYFTSYDEAIKNIKFWFDGSKGLKLVSSAKDLKPENDRCFVRVEAEGKSFLLFVKPEPVNNGAGFLSLKVKEKRQAA